ncbi:FixH family protein [Glycomyces tenuis]|uniref:copper resistance CopC/CopD family protein n=1 Tax=Glycomyces tenuis TaxID=58116 RepID=UPI00041C4AEF|nr:FixH family protein [Glycomyces tenuis]
MIARRLRPPGRALLLVLAALILSLAPAQSAQAHAALLGTDPENGIVLDRAPEAVTLSFNEPVQPVAESIRLVDGLGREQPLTAEASDDDVVVELPADLADGPYHLNWRVISADGHPIAGVVSFAVGTETPPPAPAAPVEADAAWPWAVQAVNVLYYLGLLVCCGLVFFRIAIARELSPSRPPRPLLLASGSLAVLAAALAVPLGALELAAQPLGRVVDVDAWSALVRTEAVAALALTAAGLCLALWCVTRGRGPGAAPVALAGCALAVCGPLLVGHSMSFGPRWLMVASDAVHVGTGAIWAGGLAGLAITLGRLRRGGRAEDAAVVVSRFSTWAGASVAVLGVSGLGMALMIHREWDGLFGSDHGRALLIKLGLVAVALGLAGWNRFRLVPLVRGAEDARAGLTRLRRVVRVEAAVVAAVIALTGVLVNLTPTAEEPPEAADVAVEEHLHDDLGEGAVEAHLDPGTIGENTLMLTLTDAQGAPLAPEEAPVVSATLPERDFGPVEAEVHELGPGEYHCVLDLPLTGTWEIDVQVRVSRYASETASLTVAVE